MYTSARSTLMRKAGPIIASSVIINLGSLYGDFPNHVAHFGLGGRFPFSLTLPNRCANAEGKYSPVITPGIFLLRVPRVITFTLNFSEGQRYPNIFLGQLYP